jgi:hypothetical protein
MPDDEAQSRFHFRPDTLADKQRDSLNTRTEIFTENYFDLRERTFSRACESANFSRLRRADEEKWFINKQKEGKEKNLCWVAND